MPEGMGYKTKYEKGKKKTSFMTRHSKAGLKFKKQGGLKRVIKKGKQEMIRRKMKGKAYFTTIKHGRPQTTDELLKQIKGQ